MAQEVDKAYKKQTKFGKTATKEQKGAQAQKPAPLPCQTIKIFRFFDLA